MCIVVELWEFIKENEDFQVEIRTEMSSTSGPTLPESYYILSIKASCSIMFPKRNEGKCTN